MEFVLIFQAPINKAKAAAEIQYISKSVAPVIAVFKVHSQSGEKRSDNEYSN
jgi:hypothetical protein